MLGAILSWGIWLGQLLIPGQLLPFNFELVEEGNKPVMIIHNATERIRCDEISLVGDSMFIRMPFFDSEFRLKNDGRFLAGVWINHGRKDNPQIPFSAIHGVSYRFKTEVASKINITGKWETWFDTDTPDSSLAVGIFNQQGNIVTGTFLTETGDHRYIEGVMDGDSLRLSVFDGVHAWLYIAKADSKNLSGTFYSGNHYHAPFHANRNDSIKLRDANTITKTEGKIQFNFPDLDSVNVALKDSRFHQKVVILQIMGSWCPNCMDESILFNKIYEERKEEGLEIIGLAFEKSSDFNIARQNLKRMKNLLGISYPILIAGVTGKDNVMKALPFVKDFISFPTTIFLNRKGEAVKVHAGYSGPATGSSYEAYQADLKRTLDRLLR